VNQIELVERLTKEFGPGRMLACPGCRNELWLTNDGLAVKFVVEVLDDRRVARSGNWTMRRNYYDRRNYRTRRDDK